MSARNVTFQIRWEQDASFKLKPCDTIVLEDGTTLENGGGTVTITHPTTDNDGSEVPGKKTEIKLPNGGKVDTSGNVEANGGTKPVNVKDPGSVNTATITDDAHISSDGNITFPPTDPENPGGTSGTVTVTKPGGEPEDVTVGGETEGLDIETGEVPPYVHENKKVQIGDTIITLPEEWVENPENVLTKNEDGSAKVPEVSEIKNSDDKGNQVGETITVPEGGETIFPGGNDVILKPGENCEVPDTSKVEYMNLTSPDSPRPQKRI